MKKSLVAVFAVLLCLIWVISSVSCVKKDANAASSSASAGANIVTKAQLTELETDVDKKLETKLDKSVWDAYLQIAPKDGSSVDAYNKDEVYTKAQVNALIKDLKEDQSWIEASSAPSVPAGGETTESNGYTISLDHDQVISLSSETGNSDITLTVTNETGVAGYPSLVISLRPLSPSTFEITKLDAAHRHLKIPIVSSFDTYQEGIVQANPEVDTLLKKLYWVSPEFSIISGASKTIWLDFDVRTTNAVTWQLEVKVL